LDFVFESQILQRPKEYVPVTGEAHVALLSRKRRARNMSDTAPQSSLVYPFNNHRSKEKTWDHDPPDQTARRGRCALRGSWVNRPRRPPAERTLTTQHAIEVPALSLLENPRVHQSESAIAQK
jgi:hypothetical protein